MTDNRMPLVIKELSDDRHFLTRARIANAITTPTVNNFQELLTDVGKSLVALLIMIDGIEIYAVDRHSVAINLVHPRLWSWMDVESEVIRAFADALALPAGETFEIVREKG